MPRLLPFVAAVGLILLGTHHDPALPLASPLLCQRSRPYILKGKVEEDLGAITLTVHWIGFLDKYQGSDSVSHKTYRRLPRTSQGNFPHSDTTPSGK